MNELNQDPNKDIIPSDTPEIKPPAASADTGQLIFGKYKTMEEAEEGERNRERKLHALGQQNSALREQVDEYNQRVAELESTPKPVYNVPQTAEEASEKLLKDPMGFLNEFVDNKIKPLAEATLENGSRTIWLDTYARLGEEDRKNYLDWDKEIGNKITQLNMSPYDPKTPLRAYNMIKAERILAEKEQLQSEVNNNRQRQDARNQRAVAMGSGGAPTPSAYTDEQLQDMPLDELKKIANGG